MTHEIYLLVTLHLTTYHYHIDNKCISKWRIWYTHISKNPYEFHNLKVKIVPDAPWDSHILTHTITKTKKSFVDNIIVIKDINRYFETVRTYDYKRLICGHQFIRLLEPVVSCSRPPNTRAYQQMAIGWWLFLSLLIIITLTRRRGKYIPGE